MKRTLMLCATLVLLAGCSSVTSRKPMPVSIERVSPAAGKMLAASVAQAQMSGTQPGDAKGALQQVGQQDDGLDPVSEATRQLAAQLTAGLKENHIRRLPLAVLRFHKLGQKTYAGPLGERLSDSFIYQLERRGYNLVDYRAVSLTTTYKPEPDPSSLSLLYSRNRIYFVLTGTYARYPDGVVINARVLDTTTRQVLASAQTHIPDSRLEARWPGYDPLEAAAKGMIVEGPQGPLSPQGQSTAAVDVQKGQKRSDHLCGSVPGWCQ